MACLGLAASDMELRPRFLDCAESALIVDFGAHYDKVLSLKILGISEQLSALKLRGFQESVPALASLTIFYDPLELRRDDLVAVLDDLCKAESSRSASKRRWEIPVSYGGERGPDLAHAATSAGLTEADLVALHSEPFYHVYMLGFLPGFAYLGDLPERLRLPRRSTPRPRVPRGSVAIVSDMTAVYPLESPGGWHFIGFTPVALWDMERSDTPLFQPGDEVKFKPVSSSEAEALRQDAADGWRPSPLEAA